MFDVPVPTLKDWEQGRRKPPAYVINMMRTILQYKGMIISQSYVEACDVRRKSVENAMAIMLSATNGPDELFLELLEKFETLIGERVQKKEMRFLIFCWHYGVSTPSEKETPEPAHIFMALFKRQRCGFSSGSTAK